MANASGEGQPDPTLQLVIDDVRVLRDALRDARDPDTEKRVMQVAAGYLIVNRELIDRAFAAWRATPEETLHRMDHETQALDYSAASHDFEPVAYEAMQFAPDVLRGYPWLITYSENNLHMLLRVFEYAKHLVEPETGPVYWHPVRTLLADPENAAALLGQLRKELTPDASITDSKDVSRRSRSTPLSDLTEHALALAAELPTASTLGAPDDPGLVAAATLIGALRLPASESTDTVIADIRAYLVEQSRDDDIVGRATDALGIRRLPPPASNGWEAAAHAPRFFLLLGRAATFSDAFEAERIELHHLLAAALAPEDPTVLETMLRALGTTLPALRARLREAVGRVPDESPVVWDRVLGPSAVPVDLAGGISADLVDPTRGIPLGDDRLGVADYVTMLATVIADARTPMPLSIGLFGDWGSGKSTFMSLLREQVDALSRSSSETYLGDIRQIGFNAWHYSDTNLWASLGDEIFAQLAGPGEQADEKADRLRRDLAELLPRRQELEQRTEQAEHETVRLSSALDDARAQRAHSLRHVAAAVASTDELEKAFRHLGIHEPVEQSELLAQEIRGSAVELDVLHSALAGSRGPLLAALAATFAILMLCVIVLPSEIGRGAITAVVPLLAAAGWVIARVHSGLRLLNGIAKRIRDSTDEQTAKELSAVRESEAKVQVLQAQLDEVIDQVGELGRQLTELDPGRRLYRFVADRADGDTYRRHLGLISTVRRDFEQLAKLMKEWRADPDPETPDPIDRIVLYIDDLDRCSPKQVVDVLQAVHLLLALDLFVVVVGVDPRWLVHSLRREYRSILTSDDGRGDDAWATTPQAYLEKIFNIPFALPGLTSASFRGLLEGMAAVDAGTGSSDRPAPPPTKSDDPPAVPPTADDSLDVPAGAMPVERGSEVASVQAGEPESEPHPLSQAELNLLAALAPLVASPREAKRLLNLYRMVRSTRNLSPAARFLGDHAHVGDHQAVIVLLGLLSGHGQLLEAVLTAEPQANVEGGLLHRASSTTWAQFAAGLRPRGSDAGWRNAIVGEILGRDLAAWRHLSDGLIGVTQLVTLADIDSFQLWAPRIARFSFHSTACAAEPAMSDMAGSGSPN